MNLVVFAALTAAVALAASAVLWLSGTPLVGYDDANIFFVYARNLVNGHGFVYNVGGERVEGFSSLLWLLVCSAARIVTSRFEVVLFAVNVVLIGAAAWQLTLFLTAVLRRAGIERSRTTAVALVLTAVVIFSPGFLVWNVVSLMDSGLWSSLLLFGTIATLRSAIEEDVRYSARTLPMLVVLLVVTRPEALLWGPVFIALSIVVCMMSGSGVAAAMRAHVSALLALAISTGGLTLWRLNYFGYSLPNTYYAKGGDPFGSRITAGLGYFVDFASSNPAVVGAIAAAAAGAVYCFKRSRSIEPDTHSWRILFVSHLVVLALLAVGCAIPIIEGGDHFGFWRMYQPLTPLVAIQAVLTMWVIAGAGPEQSSRRSMMVLGLAVALTFVPWRHWPALAQLEYTSPAAPGGAWNTPKVEIAIAEDMRIIGDAFNRAFPDQPPSVGVIVAGGFALQYRGATIDLMGLNNVAMAHSPGRREGMRNHAAFSHEVFFALAPDIVLLSLWSPERPDWFGFPMLSGEFDQPRHLRPDYFPQRAASMAAFDGGVLKGLLTKTRIGETYAWASVRPSTDAKWIHAVFSRDFLRRLGDRGYEISLPIQ